MVTQKEKRAMTRAAHDLDCSLVINGEVFICRIRNVSLTGLLVETGEDIDLIQVGGCLTIKLQALDADTALSEILCCVAWVRKRCVGLKFSAIDFTTLTMLKDILYEKVQDRVLIDKEMSQIIGRS